MALIANNISGSIANQSRIGITGSVIIANVHGAVFPSLPGNDTTFFVSGSTAAGRSNVSVFGGGVVISGSVTQGSFISGGATGRYSMANGDSTVASGASSHAEGIGTTASGDNSHAEGASTMATGEGSHAEGSTTMSSGDYSHAEGLQSLASGLYSHAEGYLTTGSGDYSHSEGSSSRAEGSYSHAEGRQTTATANYSHAEGWLTVVSVNGLYAHAEGLQTTADATYSHAEGRETNTQLSAPGSHAEGYKTTTIGNYSHAEGYLTTGSGDYSHAEGYASIASGTYSHAEGLLTFATGSNSHAEGQQTIAASAASHAEGYLTITTGLFSHAEGQQTRASGDGSHAEGYLTTGSGGYSHAEGYRSLASGLYSHAEGGPIEFNTDGGTLYFAVTASANYSHAEGVGTLASGEGSHAEGYSTTASGIASHAGGVGTIAAGDYQTVVGKYNISDSNANALFIVGDGTSVSSRDDAFKVTTTGSITNVPATFNNSTVFNGTANTFNDQVALAQGSQAASTTFANNALTWQYTNITNVYRWACSIDTGGDLQFLYSLNSTSPLTAMGFINNAGSDIAFNFTGQHRSMPAGNIFDYTDKIGLIVKATGDHAPASGSSITINDAIPVVNLTTTRNDKRCFGVVSDAEDVTETTREYGMGRFVSVYQKASVNDNRLFINSLGEGCVWVCNINGDLENGDYITTCEIPGHGMRQDDDLLHNYTVAKITMDCTFDLASDKYRCEEFVHDGTTYRKAFVACTYHCG